MTQAGRNTKHPASQAQKKAAEAAFLGGYPLLFTEQ